MQNSLTSPPVLTALHQDQSIASVMKKFYIKNRFLITNIRYKTTNGYKVNWSKILKIGVENSKTDVKQEKWSMNVLKYKHCHLTSLFNFHVYR